MSDSCDRGDMFDRRDRCDCVIRLTSVKNCDSFDRCHRWDIRDRCHMSDICDICDRCDRCSWVYYGVP